MMYKQHIEEQIKQHQEQITQAMLIYQETGDQNQLDFANIRRRQMEVLKKLLPKAKEKPLTPDQAYARRVVGIRW